VYVRFAQPALADKSVNLLLPVLLLTMPCPSVHIYFSLQVLLYGAIVQTATPGNPAGLEHGWVWLARSLNALPPTR
jgi:hypothetical protein